jgi:hypothetical protein
MDAKTAGLAAYHEAGHAIAALALGREIGTARLYEEIEDDRRAGETTMVDNRPVLAFVLEGDRDYRAERRAREDGAIDLAADYAAHRAGYHGVSHQPQIYARLGRYRASRLQARAERIIDARWPDVEQLAHLLLAQHSVAGSEIPPVKRVRL